MVATPSDEPAKNSSSTKELEELFFDAVEQRGHARLADIARYPTHDAGVDETLDEAFDRSARRLASLADDVGETPTSNDELGSPAIASPPLQPESSASPTSALPAPQSLAQPPREPPPVAPLTPQVALTQPVESGGAVRDQFFGAPSSPVPGSTQPRQPLANGSTQPSGGQTLALRPVVVACGLLASAALVALAWLFVSADDLPSVDPSSATIAIDRCGPTSVSGQATNFELEARTLAIEVRVSQGGDELAPVSHLVNVEAGQSTILAIPVPDAAQGVEVECRARIVTSTPRF